MNVRSLESESCFRTGPASLLRTTFRKVKLAIQSDRVNEDAETSCLSDVQTLNSAFSKSSREILLKAESTKLPMF